MVVDDEGSVWFRQSWLDQVDRCPERGRLHLVEPEFNAATNDAAMIGTGAHAAIAAVLQGKAEPEEVGPLAYNLTIKFCERADVRWVNWTLPGQLADLARRCAQGWVTDILPSIERGGLVEQEFKVPLFEYRGRTVGITGTMDYVQPNGVIVDWKTASRKFTQKEKQRTAIQPTVYSVAAVHGGLDRPFEYPVTFRFGVMVRGDPRAAEPKITTQIVDVQRVHAHEGWLLDKIESYLDLADALGVMRRWPRNEDHYLCNATWCPWWSVCKGARLSTDQDLWSA